MARGPDDLHVLATEFLDAIVSAQETIPDALDAEGSPLADAGLVGAPDRTFTHFGPPVLDCCDQTAVYVLTLTKLVQGTKAGHPSMPGPRLVAVATRCVPQGTTRGKGDAAVYIPPSPAALSAASRQHHADGWAIFNHVENLIRAGLFLASCDRFTWEGLVPVQPSGGCAGWQATVQIELSGYAEEL